jgi:hypothetical protein
VKSQSKVELFKDNKWIPVDMSTIKQGDRFRIINKYTNIVIADKVALRDAFQDENGEWLANTGVLEDEKK